MQRELARVDKVLSVLDRQWRDQVEEVRVRVREAEDKGEQWRAGMEDAEGKRMVEVHAAMKMLNGNVIKLAKDGRDRWEMADKEMERAGEVGRGRAEELGKKVDDMVRQVEERVLMVIDKYVKTRQGGISAGGGGQEQWEQRVENVREEMKAYTERVMYLNTEKILEAKAKSELLLEGRCNAYSISLEQKNKDAQ